MPSSSSSSRTASQRRGRSRVRRRASDEVASERNGSPPRKQRRLIVLSNKRRPPSDFGIAARMITRIHKMIWEPFAVVNAGIALIALSIEDEDAAATEIASASDDKRVLYDIFHMLCERIPGLEDTTDWSSVRSFLDRGKDSARTKDNHTLKIVLPEWELDGKKWDPPLNAKTKDDRGLNHPECARLLAPTSVNWDNEIERENFRTHYEPAMTVTQHWPAFMYLGYVGDVQNLAGGLLRSEILVRAARALIYPPTVANKDNKPDHRSNRRTKADAYRMEEVTPSFLAYVAVAVRFTLSSESSFQLRGGLFNYERFYNDIVTYLIDSEPIFKLDTDELIEWWNTSSGLFTRKHTDPVEEPESMLAQLRTQAEARGPHTGENDS